METITFSPFIVVACFGLLLGIISLIFSLLALIMILGLKESTHKIQYVPLNDPVFNKNGETAPPVEGFQDEHLNKDENYDELNGGVDKKFMENMKKHIYPDIDSEMV